MKVSSCLVAKSCLTLCKPRDGSSPGSSVHGISQARILEWVAISFFRVSFWPKDWTQVSCSGRWILYHWATRDDQKVVQEQDIYTVVKVSCHILLANCKQWRELAVTLLTRRKLIFIIMRWFVMKWLVMGCSVKYPPLTAKYLCQKFLTWILTKFLIKPSF